MFWTVIVNIFYVPMAIVIIMDSDLNFFTDIMTLISLYNCAYMLVLNLSVFNIFETLTGEIWPGLGQMNQV